MTPRRMLLPGESLNSQTTKSPLKTTTILPPENPQPRKKKHVRNAQPASKTPKRITHGVPENRYSYTVFGLRPSAESARTAHSELESTLR